MENTRTSLEKNLMELFRDMFMTYQVDTIRADLKWITKAVNEESKYKVSKIDVKKYFEKKGYKLELGRVSIPSGFNEMGGSEVPSLLNYTARYYELHAQDWVKDDKQPTTIVEQTELPFS